MCPSRKVGGARGGLIGSDLGVQMLLILTLHEGSTVHRGIQGVRRSHANLFCDPRPIRELVRNPLHLGVGAALVANDYFQIRRLPGQSDRLAGPVVFFENLGEIPNQFVARMLLGHLLVSFCLLLRSIRSR